MSLLDLDRIRRTARLWLEAEELEAQLKAKVQELRNLSSVVADNLVSEGVLRFPVSVDGKSFTTYIRSTLSLRGRGGVDADARIAALRASGLDWMIRPSYAPGTLTAWAKEELASERPLPEPLVAAFNVHAEDELCFTGATKKTSIAARAIRYMRSTADAANDSKKNQS